MAIDERLFNPISVTELERRWAAVRALMAERKIDALVMQQNNDWLGGYVRWFTDTPLSNGYPRTVIFHANDPMTVIDMGARGARRKLDGDRTNPGVGEIICTPAFTSVNLHRRIPGRADIRGAAPPQLPHRRLARGRRHAAQVRGAGRKGHVRTAAISST